MKRLLTPFLLLFALVLGAAPARAYCVANNTSMPLTVKLKSYSPLGGFEKVVQPGHKICCDWFDRRCNPPGKQNAVVSLSIKDYEKRVGLLGPLGDEGGSSYVPVPTFDMYGNADPNGHYDRHGKYDPHGFKPYYERIPTFDEHGNPDPNGHYDRYGVYDANGHQGRHGRLVLPRRNAMGTGPEDPKAAKGHYCVRGTMPLVLVSGDGTVSVSEDSLKPGGLNCESRDHFLRPIMPPSQAIEFGLPMPTAPITVGPRGTRRNSGSN